jgi:tetratricopeptide (TPR) repeat protein
MGLGADFSALNRVDEALQHDALAADAAPDNGEAQLNRAKLLMRSGDFSAAVPRLTRCIELDPEPADRYILLAMCDTRLGQSAAAIANFQSALQRNPNLAAVHRALAELLLRNGRTAEAAAELRRAVALDPGDAAVQAQVQTMSRQR